MPKLHFSNLTLHKIKPIDNKGAWYSDTETKGLQIWAGAAGKKTWYIHYRRPDTNKQAYFKLGDVSYMPVQDARKAAINFLAALNRGESPWEKYEVKVGKPSLSLEKFLDTLYGPWVIENRRGGATTLRIIKNSFRGLLGLFIEGISLGDVEAWLSWVRKEKKLKASSINRAVTALKAALNWAVKRGFMEGNNMARMEKLREDDSDTRIRYLLPEERARLMAALDKLDETDYLRPMVLIALNTGIRRGALRALEWRDIDFDNRVLTLRASAEKSGKENHVPLNQPAFEAFQVLKARGACGGSAQVFPTKKRYQREWERLRKEAGLEDFRWHDMRHDFASQLVMRGVDLNTVRELLGHSDMKMTLRYAHLAPEVKRAAVDLLDKGL